MSIFPPKSCHILLQGYFINITNFSCIDFPENDMLLPFFILAVKHNWVHLLVYTYNIFLIGAFIDLHPDWFYCLDVTTATLAHKNTQISLCLKQYGWLCGSSIVTVTLILIDSLTLPPTVHEVNAFSVSPLHFLFAFLMTAIWLQELECDSFLILKGGMSPPAKKRWHWRDKLVCMGHMEMWRNKPAEYTLTHL